MESSPTYHSPLLDQEEGDVFPNRTCVERGGAVRSALGRGDLDHGEYDSVIHVHWNASARDLQGCVDVLLSLVAR